MSRALSGLYWNGRLGGRITPKKDMDAKKPHISETPERMGDKVLRNRVCGDGKKCRGCECIDKCRFGMEFVRRGLDGECG